MNWNSHHHHVSSDCADLTYSLQLGSFLFLPSFFLPSVNVFSLYLSLSGSTLCQSLKQHFLSFLVEGNSKILSLKNNNNLWWAKKCKILLENSLYLLLVILKLSGGLYISSCTQIGYSVVFDICVGSQFLETLSPCFHMALFIRLEELRKCYLGLCAKQLKNSAQPQMRERERDKLLPVQK